eukprot:263891-Prorocentrum_minimum.AAC.1
MKARSGSQDSCGPRPGAEPAAAHHRAAIKPLVKPLYHRRVQFSPQFSRPIIRGRFRRRGRKALCDKPLLYHRRIQSLLPIARGGSSRIR